ncbi:phosphopantetheine-binding protein [Streptomyces niveus]|uniref:phosphopantetheine-binding protein n=1 Tax=Streptomyces niveus TaxID=193462 RepID=UPI0036D27A66
MSQGAAAASGAGAGTSRGTSNRLTETEGLALFDPLFTADQPLLVPARFELAALRGAGPAPAVLRGLVRTVGRPSRGHETDAPPSADNGRRARLAGLSGAEADRTPLRLVRAEAAEVLGHDGVRGYQAVLPHQGFLEMGFDSLTAVELRNRLGERTGLRPPATLLFDCPTAAEVADSLRPRLLDDTPGAPKEAPPAPDLETQLAQLEPTLTTTLSHTAEGATIAARLRELAARVAGSRGGARCLVGHRRGAVLDPRRRIAALELSVTRSGDALVRRDRGDPVAVGGPSVPRTGLSAILPAVERIDPIIQPVPAAGTDPGYIPGLMAPRLVEETDDTAKDVPQEAADEKVTEEVPEAAEEAETPRAQADDEADPKADDEADEAVSLTKDASDDSGTDPGTEGPVFEVSDRRASMTADRTGIRLTLDEEEAEFGWDEIGAVEVETPRFGRRFTVTLHTTGRRHYQSEVDAPSRSSLKEWTAELDVVLDAYFEEA